MEPDRPKYLPIRTRSTLSEQTLEPGQSTQFIACFPTMETNTTLKLTYDDNGTMSKRSIELSGNLFSSLFFPDSVNRPPFLQSFLLRPRISSGIQEFACRFVVDER